MQFNARVYNRVVGIALVGGYAAFGSAAPGQRALSPKAHQFDFWIGAWDVNLRIKQTDGTWKDQIQAREYTYGILDGKAVLELWSETSRESGRKGYSLRYFRDDIDQWELWLNWPGRNLSGSGSLRGDFRHNRGEFFSESKQADSSTLTARYTFSDITPTSLRWDDAYSTDSGKTWTNQWIMEFIRRSALPPALSPKVPANSYGLGALCDRPEFREFEKLNGEMAGSIKYRGSPSEEWKTSAATLTTYKIIGGCATISFLEYVRNGVRYKRFSQNTYNTMLNAFEVGELDNVPGTKYNMFVGQSKDAAIELDGSDENGTTRTGDRSVWKMTAGTLRLDEYRKIGDAWVLMTEGTFARR